MRHHPWFPFSLYCQWGRAMVAHAFNPSTWEAEAGRFLSSRLAWSIVSSRTARTTRKILSRKTKQNILPVNTKICDLLKSYESHVVSAYQQSWLPQMKPWNLKKLKKASTQRCPGAHMHIHNTANNFLQKKWYKSEETIQWLRAKHPGSIPISQSQWFIPVGHSRHTCGVLMNGQAKHFKHNHRDWVKCCCPFECSQRLK